VGGRYQVVPNRLFRKAGELAGGPDLAKDIKGPTAMVVGSGDAVETARTLAVFMKENDAPRLRSGALDGRALGAADILALASLPPRPVLQSMVVGTMAAPMRNLAGVLHQKVASILYALKAVQAKKEQSAAA
jgi:large subunit ribosomal protein L10